MWTTLGYIGLLVVLGYIIKVVANAVQISGLQEFSIKFRFKGNEKPPKQLNR